MQLMNINFTKYLLALPLLVAGSVFLGWAVAIAPVPAVILGMGLVGLMSLFLIGDRVALWATLIICLAMVGPVESFGRVPKIFWLSYFLGLFLFAKASLIWMGRRHNQNNQATNAGGFPVVLFTLLILILVVGTAIAAPDSLQVMLASRDYVWIWGFFALVVALRIQLQEQIKWFRLLPWLVVLQVPVVIYQHFFVAGSTLFASHDAVTGLFGGNPEGGGASGAMGFFALLMALYTIDRMRSGHAGIWVTLLIVASALTSIALAEVKYVAMTAPVIALAFFGVRETIRSPKALASILLLLLASPAILYGYWKAFEAPGAKGHASFEKYLSLIVERNVDQEQIDFRTGEMGRVAAILFWVDKNSFATDPVTTSIGHGAGSSRIGLIEGEVAKNYRFNIARSTLVVFLWEAGALGAFCLVVLLMTLAARTNAVMRSMPKSDGEARAVMRLSSAAFVVALISLPYNTDLIGTPQFQLLFVMCCAALYMSRYRLKSQTVAQPPIRIGVKTGVEKP